jgi:hypothetical protein
MEQLRLSARSTPSPKAKFNVMIENHDVMILRFLPSCSAPELRLPLRIPTTVFAKNPRSQLEITVDRKQGHQLRYSLPDALVHSTRIPSEPNSSKSVEVGLL